MMNDFRLFLRFDAVPSDEEIDKIGKLVDACVRTAFPGAVFKIQTGRGSWWILAIGAAASIAGWLIVQIAEWALERGLDQLAEKVQASRTSPSYTQQELITLQDARGYDGYEQFSSATSNIISLMDATGAYQFQLSEWNHEVGQGRIYSVQKTERGLSINYFRTDSQDEFNSRTEVSR